MSANRSLIEKEANDFRSLCNIESYGVANIFEVCEQRDIYLVRYPMGEDGICGAAICKDGNKIIVTNSSMVLSREIFTVAHELGHIVLRHIDKSNCFYDNDFDDKNDVEVEANLFAASFLMPREKVQAYVWNNEIDMGNVDVLEIAKMQSVFNVSFEALIARLNYLNLIKDSKANLLKQKKQEEAVSNLLRAVGASPQLCFKTEAKRIPSEFLKWLKSNYENELISFEVFAKGLSYVDLKPEDIDVKKVKRAQKEFDLEEYFGGTE